MRQSSEFESAVTARRLGHWAGTGVTLIAAVVMVWATAVSVAPALANDPNAPFGTGGEEGGEECTGGGGGGGQVAPGCFLGTTNTGVVGCTKLPTSLLCVDTNTPDPLGFEPDPVNKCGFKKHWVILTTPCGRPSSAAACS